jgi:hypothetical protein
MLAVNPNEAVVLERGHEVADRPDVDQWGS